VGGAAAQCCAGRGVCSCVPRGPHPSPHLHCLPGSSMPPRASFPVRCHWLQASVACPRPLRTPFPLTEPTAPAPPPPAARARLPRDLLPARRLGRSRGRFPVVFVVCCPFGVHPAPSDRLLQLRCRLFGVIPCFFCGHCLRDARLEAEELVSRRLLALCWRCVIAVTAVGAQVATVCSLIRGRSSECLGSPLCSFGCGYPSCCDKPLNPCRFPSFLGFLRLL
jgi:hypothetical protein